MMNRDMPAMPILARGEPTGLTKREYFAAKAMAAMISNASFFKGDCHPENLVPYLSNKALRYSDALLRELDK